MSKAEQSRKCKQGCDHYLDCQDSQHLGSISVCGTWAGCVTCITSLNVYSNFLGHPQPIEGETESWGLTKVESGCEITDREI